MNARPPKSHLLQASFRDAGLRSFAQRGADRPSFNDPGLSSAKSRSQRLVLAVVTTVSMTVVGGHNEEMAISANGPGLDRDFAIEGPKRAVSHDCAGGIDHRDRQGA